MAEKYKQGGYAAIAAYIVSNHFITNVEGADAAAAASKLTGMSAASVKTVHSLLTFCESLTRNTSVGTLSAPTLRQWSYYSVASGLTSKQQNELLAQVKVQQGVVLATTTSIHEIYGIDGNVVKKMGGRGLESKKSKDVSIPLEIWFSHALSVEEEGQIYWSLADLFIRADLLIEGDPPARNSLYRRYMIRVGTKEVETHLLELFKAIAYGIRSDFPDKQVEEIRDFLNDARIASASLLVGDLVCLIKVPVNGRTELHAAELTGDARRALEANPTLSRDPLTLMAFLGLDRRVTAIWDSKRNRSEVWPAVIVSFGPIAEATLEISPGTATTKEIDAFLDSLSGLYRALGGSGISFSVRERS